MNSSAFFYLATISHLKFKHASMFTGEILSFVVRLTNFGQKRTFIRQSFGKEIFVPMKE